MSWITAAYRLVLLGAVAAALGAYYGYTLEAISIFLVSIIAFWLYQLYRVQTWLNAPRQAPPDGFGIWGELLAHIYSHQRKHLEAQAQLQATLEYLQNSFAAIRDGVVMVDGQGVITWFNRGAGALLSLRDPQDLGQTLTNLVREPQFNSYFLGGDYTEPLQYQLTAGADQTFLRVEITHFGEGDRVLFVRDVSGAVRLEQMRRDFVANVSHELRTPLTVLTGYLATFKDDSTAFPEKYARAIEQMAQQAQRMEGLLRDLLWLSRIEAEKESDPLEDVDIAGLLQELREELKEAYPESPLELDIRSDRHVTGNYPKLYSAVSNLAINAIKYSTTDAPISIRWQVEGDSGYLSVKDRGVGIDSVHVPRLTERFYRVDDSRNSASGGTGLGLAIVKHVAATHDADLQIESKLGEGSTFTLVFPLKDDDVSSGKLHKLAIN